MLIQILTLIVLQYNRIDREYVHIFMSKDFTKKVNLVALAKRNINRNLFMAPLFLDLTTQNVIYIQGHNNMDISFFRILFLSLNSILYSNISL